MASRLNATVELWPAMPAEMRERILSGMRWTLWLSVLAAPCGYGTSILLARTGPEVIGTYGVLAVYLGLVSSVFYFGGDAVAMKFLPMLEAGRRFPFLLSYFLVVCLSLVPWLIAAAFWPEKLHYLFGERGGAPFQALILCLSPVYILFALVVAALKGMLEIPLAQTLTRVVTIGSFLLYTVLFLGPREFLSAHSTELIWGIYLGLALLASAAGVRCLVRQNGWVFQRERLGFFLPPGFWHYTLSLQQVSAMGFFLQQLHCVLVLNFGGLATLGKYVAILTVAAIIPVANNFFLDTLLPSLTNLLAARDHTAASELLSTYFRVLFVVNTVAVCGLILLAGPITALLGPRYVSLRLLVVLLVLLVGLSSPGAVGGTLLSSVGKQQRALWVSLLQLTIYTSLFLSLWPRWQLAGAVWAYGVSQFVSQTLLLAVAKRSVPLQFSAAGDYLKFALVAVGSALVAFRSAPLGFGPALVFWVGAAGLFLLLGKYRLAECMGFVRCFAPLRLGLSGAEGQGDRNPVAALPLLGPSKGMSL